MSAETNEFGGPGGPVMRAECAFGFVPHQFGDIVTHDGRPVCSLCGYVDPQPDLPDELDAYAELVDADEGPEEREVRCLKCGEAYVTTSWLVVLCRDCDRDDDGEDF